MCDPTLYFDRVHTSGANREEAISLKHSTEHGIQFFFGRVHKSVTSGTSNLVEANILEVPNIGNCAYNNCQARLLTELFCGAIPSPDRTVFWIKA